MISEQSLTLSFDWQQQADEAWQKGNYGVVTQLYEQAIEAQPECKAYYWHLGLALLLQSQETEAQTTWLFAMAEGEPEEIEQWTIELIQVLQTEADHQLELKNYTNAWVIRQHIREINPEDINNLLHLIGLSTIIKTYTGEELKEWGVLNSLNSEKDIGLDTNLLLEVLKNVLDYDPFSPSTLEFTEACLPYVKDTSPFIATFIEFIYKTAYIFSRHYLAVKYTELCLRLEPQNYELLINLSALYQDIHEFNKGIEIAKVSISIADTLTDKIYANYILMRGLMSAGGYWDEFTVALNKHFSMLQTLFDQQPRSLDSGTTLRLFASSFFFAYFQDNPHKNLAIRRQLAQIAQLNIESYAHEEVEKFRKWKSPLIKIEERSNKRLKIGYLSHCLRSHSVGWLARWVFLHHDHDRFEIYGYFMSTAKTDDPLKNWYFNHVNKGHLLGLCGKQAAEKIYEDEIDILVDLDSITLTNTADIMAIKPAPVQVTWLGWDASNIPMIDYYIADPYVLPEDAQAHYTEKIWRLPQTYIAVDGFEVGVPTLRRDELGIPNDSIIYLTAQRAYKCHPDIIRLQLKILRDVPNSYLLVKGVSDQKSLEKFFFEIAESEGIECERLKFLPLAASEEIHRANLGIADVVLDTYPYNGATTTMETLWMGIPMVTRVGEQFAARNSYTMMINAGITEGIAWTDEEYVEWGIKLGTDENLRQQIAWKLRKNRQTAPLWNGKQFTREMENAYEQMWQKYIEGKN
ncbi:O-linked N-acetylglucosamine transferase family protein [Planktothrix agardhii]|uniref:O-linked N-acetylglucosamine transferase, SPINDLY family protein n=1 Tax=Planktothrix agardhii TaxID=1160 RepID=UPI0020A8247D|nr:O-linked N-acetylglucosamine transferase, SPINDLY family protein [Planktothrix agardhii]CAD5920619.1 putative UDP-N-acetylglucosamine--peptide N-acetylglucosaminyltransferase SPINDLY [Planktothrix agardhii]